MTNYNFSSLNDREFEELVKDVLNKEFNLNLKSYPKGRDKGIDLRQSSPKTKNEIIVQVKHFVDSRFPTLKSKLIKEELPKIKLLNPKRYILATSLSLSTSQKDTLIQELFPFIKSEDDIISRIEINEYLANHRRIIIKYTRLWFSDAAVLEHLLNNGTENKSRVFLELLSKKAKFYVYPSILNDANKKLRKNKILLIIGQPGVGKSTLAEIQLLELSRKEFKVHIVDDLEEAERVFSNEKEKQVFYFDDFLGSKYSEILNVSTSETRLIRFLERVDSTPNKYVILTTRTIILNYATENYDKINKIKSNLKKYELKVEQYSKFERAKILYNHLFFKKLDDAYLNEIRRNKFYFTIIQNKNYTPRLIEFISDKFHLNDVNPENYQQFIIEILKHPKETWKHSFHKQISSIERAFILTMFTFSEQIDINTLRKAFEARMKYEKKKHNQIIEPNQFEISLKLLLNGFIVNTIYNYDENNESKLSFINPSLTDYIVKYISETPGELKAILSSIKYYKQLDRFKSEFTKTVLDSEIQEIIYAKIKNNKLIKGKTYIKDTNIYMLSYLSEFCSKLNIDEFLMSLFTKISWTNINSSFDAKQLLRSLLRLNYNANINAYQYLAKNIYSILEEIYSRIDSSAYVLEIREALEIFGYSYEEFIQSPDGMRIIEKYIINVLTSEEEDLTFSLEDEVTNINDLDVIQEKLDSIKYTMYSDLEIDGIIEVEYTFDINYDRWNDRIELNIQNRKLIGEERKNYSFEEVVSASEKNIDRKINALFA